MIILDTHIWVWWVQGDARLTKQHQNWLQQYESQELGICIMSCWEVAKLVEIGKLTLPYSIEEWLTEALAYPGVQLLELTIPIIVESTKLTGFHRDPFDQVIVATARIYNSPLLTVDAKILAYPGVKLSKSERKVSVTELTYELFFASLRFCVKLFNILIQQHRVLNRSVLCATYS